jgi:hypothetical protein
MNVISTGLRVLFGGMRRGNSALAGMGAALVAVGWLRKTARPKRELLYARTLRRGQGLRIRMLGADDEVEISG